MATTNSLRDRIRKTSTIKDTEILTNSKYMQKKDMIKMSIPALNVALSGELDGGFIPGLTIWAGPSKHFKTLFSLLMAKAYMDKYPEAVMILLDCEFGSPLSYFASIGIDTDRVVHVPIMNMEEFKFEMIAQLESFTRGDKVIFVVDSLGNMASKKELDDAIENKSTQDMTRARQMKSIFRMITPYLTSLDIPMVAVAHIYMCGTADMMVTTENGAKSLKELEVGENVLTTAGFEPVINKFKYDEAWVTDIELDDGTILSFTSQHRFKVNGEWVYVEDLKEGMVLDLV